MALSAFRCPNCHAALSVPETLDQVTCNYCQTSSRLARRTRFFERPIPPAVSTHLPTALQAHSRSWVMGIVMSSLAMVALTTVIGFVAFRRMSQRAFPLASSHEGGRVEANDDPFKPMVYGPAMLIDVNGDGTADLVSRHRNVPAQDSIAIGAYSGKDGSLIYRSPVVGSYADVYRMGLYHHRKRLYLPDDRGQLHVLDLASGALEATQVLGEKIDRLCHAADQIWVRTADAKWRDLGGASSTPTSDEPVACEPLHNDARDAQPFLNSSTYFVRQDFEGMRSEFGLALASNQVLVVGKKFPGTPVPMMALYTSSIDPTQLRRRTMPDAANAVQLGKRMREQRSELAVMEAELADAQVAWVVEMPRIDSLTASLPSQPMLAHSDKIAVSIYEKGHSHSILVAFSIENGNPLFEIDLGERAGAQSVQIEDDTIWVPASLAVKAYDAKDGSLRFSIGGN